MQDFVVTEAAVAAHQEPPAPEQQSALLLDVDYTTFPLTTEVELLQRVARDLVQGLLERRPLPTLSTLLTEAELAVHRPPLSWRTLVDRYLVYGRHALADDFGLNLQEGVRHLRQRRLVRAKAALRRWPPRLHLTILLNRLEGRLGPLVPPTIPDELLLLTAERAWRDLRFQEEIAVLLYRHLRQSVLMTQLDKVLAIFSPNTFWILVALTPPPTASGLAQLRWSHWLERWTVRRLRNLATRRALGATEWAGFWDQWLLWSALNQSPEAADRLTPMLYNALLGLPIMTLSRPALGLESVATDQVIGSPHVDPASTAGVESNSPANPAGETGNQLPRRNRFYRAGTIQRGPVVAPTFAAPNWQAAVPGWFYAYYVNNKLGDSHV